MMTLQEARELYLKSDCSYFEMCTRYYSDYIEYRQLELPKEQEDCWKNEKIQMLYKEIRKTGDFRLFGRMYEIAREFRDYDNLRIMLEALKRIKHPLKPRQRIIVVETILGRKSIKARSGLIYWAIDNGQKASAILLMDQALELLYITEKVDSDMEKSIRKQRRVCKNIISDLNLNFTKKYLKHYYNF